MFSHLHKLRVAKRFNSSQKGNSISFTAENLFNGKFNNAIREINKNPSYFRQIPIDYHPMVLGAQSVEFFNTKTLDSMSGIIFSGNLFNEYFGHIPLYHLTDMQYIPCDQYHNAHNICVTWNPEQFIKSIGYDKDEVCYISKTKITDDSTIIIFPSHCLLVDQLKLSEYDLYDSKKFLTE